MGNEDNRSIETAHIAGHDGPKIAGHIRIDRRFEDRRDQGALGHGGLGIYARCGNGAAPADAANPRGELIIGSTRGGCGWTNARHNRRRQRAGIKQHRRR